MLEAGPPHGQPGASSLHAISVRAPQAPVYTASAVSIADPHVSTCRAPTVEVVTVYHASRPVASQDETPSFVRHCVLPLAFTPSVSGVGVAQESSDRFWTGVT